MSEIYLYGEIGEYEARLVADEIKNSADADITLRINSGGGDIFAGLAICNLLKSYSGKVTIEIDGLAASAAVTVLCGGDYVRMAENALLMVHLPFVNLNGDYGAADLDNLSNTLTKIKEQIIETYIKRTGLTREKIESLIEAESWLSAVEAKELNFIDEITGAVPAEYENNVIYLNNAAISTRLDMKKLIKGTGAVERKNAMKDLVTVERERIISLNKMRSSNSAVNEIIDLAITEGKTKNEIEPYIKIATKYLPSQNKLAEVIAEQLKSGAEGVSCSIPENKSDRASTIANYANKIMGGKKNVR